MTALDRTDLALLGILAENPRATAVAIAQELGFSRNTVQARLSRLEESGVLLSYERSFSPRVLGFPQQGFLRLAVRQKELPRIITALERLPEVLQAHRLSGSVDLLVHIACRDARHLFDLDARILAIDGVERTEMSLVVDEVIPYRAAGLVNLARKEG